MKKQFLKSAAILSLAVTAVSTSQPVGAIVNRDDNLTRLVELKKESLKKEKSGRYLTGQWVTEAKGRLVKLIDVGKYLISKDEYQEEEYSEAVKNLKDVIFAYDSILLNLKAKDISHDFEVNKPQKRSSTDKKLESLTEGELNHIIIDLRNALRKFADEIGEIQNNNKDLIPVSLFANPILKQKSVLENGYFSMFYGDDNQRYGKYYRWVNWFWDSYQKENFIKEYDKTLSEILNLKASIDSNVINNKWAKTTDLEILNQKISLILGLDKKDSEFSYYSYTNFEYLLKEIVLTEDIPNLRVAKRKLEDLRAAIYDYYKDINFKGINKKDVNRVMTKIIPKTVTKDTSEKYSRKPQIVISKKNEGKILKSKIKSEISVSYKLDTPKVYGELVSGTRTPLSMLFISKEPITSQSFYTITQATSMRPLAQKIKEEVVDIRSTNDSKKQKVEQEKTKSPTPQKEAVKEQTEQKISGKTQNVEKKSETMATPQQSSTAQTSVQQPAPVQPVVQESKASQEEINAAHDAISAYKSTVNIANTAGVTTAEMTTLINTQTSNLSDVEKALGNNKVNNGAVNVLREDTARLENMIWNRAYQAIEEFNVARNTYNNQIKTETVPVDNDIEAILAGSQAKISHLDNRIGARYMDQAFVASLLEVTEMSKSISSRIKE